MQSHHRTLLTADSTGQEPSLRPLVPVRACYTGPGPHLPSWRLCTDSVLAWALHRAASSRLAAADAHAVLRSLSLVAVPPSCTDDQHGSTIVGRGVEAASLSTPAVADSHCPAVNLPQQLSHEVQQTLQQGIRLAQHAR